MSLHQMSGLTSHLTGADLPRLTGDKVLGESLPTLMSAALRMRRVSVAHGLVSLAGRMTSEEEAALRRAMSRIELPAGERTAEQDEALRLVTVIRSTCRAADAAVTALLAQPA